MINNPCKRDCPRRNAECHAKCKDYENFKAELEHENAVIRKEKNKRDEYCNFRTDMIEKSRRSRHPTNILRARGN